MTKSLNFYMIFDLNKQHSANVFEQLRVEIERDSLSTQSLLLPTVRLHEGTRMEKRTFNSAIGHEQYGFQPGSSGCGFEAMVGMMEHAVCSYQPRIEAGHTSSSIQSLVLSIQPLRMAMEETAERYASFYFS